MCDHKVAIIREVYSVYPNDREHWLVKAVCASCGRSFEPTKDYVLVRDVEYQVLMTGRKSA